MNTSLWPVVGFTIYLVVFMGGVLAVGLWYIKRRQEKPPLEFKLLRGPGESLRLRMQKFDENGIFLVGATALAPVFAALSVFGVLLWLTPTLRLSYALAIVSCAFFPALYFAGRWALRMLFRNRNDWLGYLGERVTGEALGVLTSLGYRVYHDIPAESGGAKFNVDHAVVGPNGLFVIETKTRRKGRARPGFEAHKVSYDGKCLSWPWAEDTFGLAQAERNARWLADELNRLTGFRLAAQPVLSLPGWYVVPKGLGPVIVVNHKQLVTAITRGPKDVLTGEQIELIARQLDNLCRYVED